MKYVPLADLQHLLQDFLFVLRFPIHKDSLNDIASILVLGKFEQGIILGQRLENGSLVFFTTTHKHLLYDVIA